MLRPEPLPMSPSNAMRNVGRPYRSTTREATMPDDAGMPAVARQHEAGVALRIAGALHLLQRLLQHPLVRAPGARH